MNQSSINLLPQQQYTLTASSIPQGANIEWTSNNSKVKVNGNTKATSNNVSGGTNSVTVSVDSGTAAGSYTITAKVTPSGGTATSKTCTVKVNAPVTVSATASIKRGQTTSLTATAGTSSVSGTPTYSWSTSSKSYIKINSGANTKTCTIEGVSNGSATLTLRYTYPTGNGSATAYMDVSCKVTVENAMDVIKYTTPTDTDVTFRESDFESAWKSIAPSSSTLDSVKFTTLPSSTYGTLYNGDDEKISTSDTFYTDSNKSYRDLSKVYFSPKGKSGTVTIDYTATGVKGSSTYTYNGTVEIAIGQKSGDISYTTSVNTPVDFDEDDFIDYCKDETGYTFDYVTFTSLPSSSAGTLYLNYNAGKSNNTKVSRNTEYYRSSSPYLDDITFVPANNYSGTVSIDFTGYDTRNRKFSGTLKITVGSQKGDITYTTDRNKSVDFRASDFNAYCRDETGRNLDYVYFDTPASSKGTLYYDYSGRDEKKVSDSTKYYYGDDPDLDDITFVPASSYNGSVTIPFTGYDTNGRKISGDVVVNVGETDEVIAYKATAGKAVNFATTDFNSLCKKVTGDNLDYVRFTLPASSKGTLYQTYSASGSGSSKKAASGTKYYRSPGRNDLDLNDVTFVPAGSTAGTVDISFTGESVDGDSFSGIVRITYTAAGNASVIRYTTSGTPILFRVQDFTAACSARSGAALQSVSFTPPASTQGKLYSGYASPSSRGNLIATNGASFRASGSPNLSTVAFVPKAGFSGTVTINYTGVDTDNASYTGTVEITVTAPKASATFGDVDAGYSWATPSIDFLSNAGIVTGTDKTHYSPAKNITRGDFVLMLYRAFGFKSVAGTERFRDVPADSYYAEAITAARAAGIATGGQDGKFRPTEALTRQDAMLLIQRALNASGQTVQDGASSALNGFPDKDKVAIYTRGAVSAMVQLGVVKGDGKGNLNPGGSLSRAEMATILHRVLTL